MLSCLPIGLLDDLLPCAPQAKAVYTCDNTHENFTSMLWSKNHEILVSLSFSKVFTSEGLHLSLSSVLSLVLPILHWSLGLLCILTSKLLHITTHADLLNMLKLCADVVSLIWITALEIQLHPQSLILSSLCLQRFSCWEILQAMFPLHGHEAKNVRDRTQLNDWYLKWKTYLQGQVIAVTPDQVQGCLMSNCHCIHGQICRHFQQQTYSNEAFRENPVRYQAFENPHFCNLTLQF